METGTTTSRAWWSAAAACLVVIATAAPASATPLEPPSDTDDASVALTDAAIEAMEAQSVPTVASSAADPAPSQPSADELGVAPSPTSTGGSQWLLLATMALAIVAIVVGFGAALRGRRNDQLADFAFTDGLTGLKNRRRMDADVAEQQTGTKPTATLMIDIDHFKRFNDTHGHAMGDEVLRRVGSTLNGQFRCTDVPYRYGGEEFCVLLPDTTQEEALAAGERIRAAIAATELPVGERVTASVGVSIGPASAIDETIERADRALYSAKENGRNQVAIA